MKHFSDINIFRFKYPNTPKKESKRTPYIIHTIKNPTKKQELINQQKQN